MKEYSIQDISRFLNTSHSAVLNLAKACGIRTFLVSYRPKRWAKFSPSEARQIMQAHYERKGGKGLK